MKTFDTLREGDFIHCPEEGDILKYLMWDYFSTGKKIPCLYDERSIWPSTEIYAGDYELLHRFEKNVVVEITPVSDYTAIIELLNGLSGAQLIHAVRTLTLSLSGSLTMKR